MRPFASVLFAVALALSFSGCDPREWFVCSLGYCGYAVDDVAPSRPVQLVAAPGDQQVTLSWKANEEPDLFSYEVARATTPGGPYTPIGGTFEPGFVDTFRLENGRTYHYVVTAHDDARNESPRSLEVAATPQPPPPRPRLPAPQLTVERFFEHLKVAWTAVPGARSYRLLRSTVAGGPYAQILDTSARFHFDEDVRGGTTYFYVVAAVDDSGLLGELSAEVSGTPVFYPGPTLTRLGTWGTFTLPRGIATDAAANVYVTDNPGELGRVQKFSSTGALLDSWPVAGFAYGVAVDGAGDVYVVNASRGRVEKYDDGGAPLTMFGAFSGPTGIAIDGGSVYVADSGNGRIQKFTTAGAFVTGWPDSTGARGLATDDAGDVYVADRANDRVRKYTADGDLIADITRGFNAPEGVVVDPSGRVAVADTGNDRLQVFTTAGTFAFEFGGLQGPHALASDCRSNVYVLDVRVTKYGADANATCPLTATVARRRGFSATLTTSTSRPGKLIRSRGLVRERGARARGRFTGRPGGRGRWRARFDIVADPRTGRSTARGRALLNGSRGRLCVRFTLRVTVRGRKVTSRGSFSTLGGTLRAGGRFTQTLRSGKLVLRGNALRGRGSKKLPAACRRLR